MLFTIIAFFSLILLLVLHELSHFLAAKKFGVPVEEFGIGYPPRLWGKKIAGTIYSFNLFPAGAFVRIPTEVLKSKSGWQRAIVLLAGIISFWIFAFLIFSFVLSIGTSVGIPDSQEAPGAVVMIGGVAKDSPAESAGLQAGDIVLKLKSEAKEILSVNKTAEVRQFAEEEKGKEITITVKRKEEVLNLSLIPRLSPPAGEGSMGVSLERIFFQRYTLLEAISTSGERTVSLTAAIVFGLFNALVNVFTRQPIGIELVGPVGILNIFSSAGQMGWNYFLQTLAVISLHLAVFNALPIPMTDGGKLFFLGLEKIRKKPLNEELEGRIEGAFFLLLIGMMILVSIKDLVKIF